MPITAQKKECAWDIGSSTIKILVGDVKEGSATIEQAIEVPNPVGTILPEEKPKLEQLQGLIGSIISEYNLPPRGVRLSLPESMVSTQVIEMPNLSASELSSSITWQAEQYLPIPKDELVTEHELLYKPGAGAAVDEKMRVLLIGTRKQVVRDLLEVFRANGAEPFLMETQTISLMRQVGLAETDPVTMIVQVGEKAMSIMVVQGGELSFVISYPEAGELFTKALMTSFSLSKENAEAYKASYGLLPDQADGKIYEALKPIADLILANIRNALTFYTSKVNGQYQVQQVLWCGGTAQMLGLIDYIKAAVQIEMGMIDNFAGFSGNLPERNQISFGVALGLLKRQM